MAKIDLANLTTHWRRVCSRRLPVCLQSIRPLPSYLVHRLLRRWLLPVTLLILLREQKFTHLEWISNKRPPSRTYH